MRWHHAFVVCVFGAVSIKWKSNRFFFRSYLARRTRAIFDARYGKKGEHSTMSFAGLLTDRPTPTLTIAQGYIDGR